MWRFGTHGNWRFNTPSQKSAGSVYQLKKMKLNAVFS